MDHRLQQQLDFILEIDKEKNIFRQTHLSGHLGPIRTMGIGDDVYFVNVNGLLIHYQVDNLELLGPFDVEDMIDGDYWDLSLFTCNASGQRRCTVRCTKIE